MESTKRRGIGPAVILTGFLMLLFTYILFLLPTLRFMSGPILSLLSIPSTNVYLQPISFLYTLFIFLALLLAFLLGSKPAHRRMNFGLALLLAFAIALVTHIARVHLIMSPLMSPLYNHYPEVIRWTIGTPWGLFRPFANLIGMISYLVLAFPLGCFGEIILLKNCDPIADHEMMNQNWHAGTPDFGQEPSPYEISSETAAQLRQNKKMLDDNLITPEEFEQNRKSILGIR